MVQFYSDMHLTVWHLHSLIIVFIGQEKSTNIAGTFEECTQFAYVSQFETIQRHVRFEFVVREHDINSNKFVVRFSAEIILWNK